MRCRSIWKRFEHHSSSTACARVSLRYPLIRKARAHRTFRGVETETEHTVPGRSVGPCGYPAAYTQDPAARRTTTRAAGRARSTAVVRAKSHTCASTRGTGPREGGRGGGVKTRRGDGTDT